MCRTKLCLCGDQAATAWQQLAPASRGAVGPRPEVGAGCLVRGPGETLIFTLPGVSRGQQGWPVGWEFQATGGRGEAAEVAPGREAQAWPDTVC